VDDSGAFSSAPKVIPVLVKNEWNLLRDTLEVAWSGTLQSAELELVFDGTQNTYLDNLGLTQFYRTNLVFESTQWPNGHFRDRSLVFGVKSVGGQLVNTDRRRVENTLSGDPVFLALDAAYEPRPMGILYKILCWISRLET